MYKFIFIISLCAAGSGWAHPVSFEDSKGVMGYHSPVLSHFQLNYSFRHWFAVGVHHFDIPDTRANRFSNFVSTNFLLKRWNGPSYQGNIYAVLGVGQSKFGDTSLGATLTKLQFDIEDRQYYFLTSYSQINSVREVELQDLVVRAGVAPYVASYKDIHSWLILEWRSNNVQQQGAFEDVTPFLRIFYKNLLFEIGQSFNGLTRFNYIAHF